MTVTLQDLRRLKADALARGERPVSWDMSRDAMQALRMQLVGDVLSEELLTMPVYGCEMLGLPVLLYDVIHDSTGRCIHVRLVTER